MKTLQELTFGFTDAENYRRRENKTLFSRIFLHTDALDGLQQPSTFFLVGEKGTGKTAYAVYLSNTPSSERYHAHKFIRETDYAKFVSLKQQQSLGLSEYTDIWKVIIYALMAGSIIEHENTDALFTKAAFSGLRKAIEEYYEGAFSPEILSGLQLVENSEEVVKLLVKYAGVAAGGDVKNVVGATKSLKRFQTDLLKIQKSFEKGFSSISLLAHHTLFIDGIDIRPENIPFTQYLECVKGLANALWSVNNDFFPSIKDSRGRMKVVALLRPDIYNSLGLQNRNTKLKDNAVILDWRTRYTNYRSSDLFKIVDKLLAVQQTEKIADGAAWDYYFPFHASSHDPKGNLSSFITVLRYTFHRPRDILSILDTLETLYVKSGEVTNYFTERNLTSPEFRRAFGIYMLGEIKDSLSFYYDEAQYQLFLKFFEYLDGANRFDYSKFINAYAQFMIFVGDQKLKIPDFMGSAEDYLQFLYDQNILSYIEGTEDKPFIRWCFIERSHSNISPKVKTHSNYEIHYGLANALNTGKKIHSTRKSATAVLTPAKGGFFEGNVKLYNKIKKFGFIIQDGMPVDMFFHGSRVLVNTTLSKGVRVRFRLEKDVDGRLMAVDIMNVKAG
jgi:cold shock CspA family protein